MTGKASLIATQSSFSEMMGPAPSFCPLFLCELAMIGSNLCQARKTVPGKGPMKAPPYSLRHPTGGLAGRRHGVPRRIVSAPIAVRGPSKTTLL